MRSDNKNDERSGKDRWLVSYADFMTLLFAFFVVMYSLSTINNEKYAVFSRAIGASFPASYKKLSMLSNEELSKFISIVENGQTGSLLDDEQLDKMAEESGSFENVDLALKIKTKFQRFMVDKTIRLKVSADWLEIEVGSNLLFNSGSSFLNSDSELIIKELAEILSSTSNTLTIEGFTDNVPIYNTIFPSNWELSADRASSVARAFIAAGIVPARLAVTGYGENFPIADNTTASGRQKNRRIIIVVEKENKRKKYLETHK